jgi:hypothetical protein
VIWGLANEDRAGKRVAIYARVSTKDKGQTTANQKAERGNPNIRVTRGHFTRADSAAVGVNFGHRVAERQRAELSGQ